MNSQIFFEKSLSRILSVLFFVIPLSYAWLYIPGIPVTLADLFPFLGGFEKVKIGLFLTFISLATVLFLGTRRLKHSHLVILGVFFVWTFFSFIVNGEINPYFWFGNGEKWHGWYLYLGLLMLGIILSTSTQKEQKKYITVSLVSGCIVCLYAIFQKIGFDPIQSLYNSRLDTTRIFGTLGNPNYLAGYVLILMPFSLVLARSKKLLGWGLFGLFALVLFLTKSLFGIGVFLGYIFYSILYKILPLQQKTRHYLMCGFVGIGFMAGGYIIHRYGEHLLEIQKIKGFIARYFLWETGIHSIFGDIRNTLFGYGPDGFLAISELFRSPELSVFEDPAFRIDRSHNVWIDILIHWGVPLGSYIIYCIFSQWKKIPTHHREILIIFSIFFFFNIPVLVHYLLILQILTFDQSPR